MHGGTEFVVVQLANTFVQHGYGVTILCTYNLGEPAYSIDKRVKIQYLTNLKPNRSKIENAMKQKKILKILKESLYAIQVLAMKKIVLARIFRKIKKGIIISSRNEDTVLLSKFGRKTVLKIGHIHHNVEQNDIVAKSITNKYKNIDAVVFLTEELRKQVMQFTYNKTIKTRYVTIENAIIPLYADKMNFQREKMIISAGRLHPDKGYFRLLEAFKEINEYSPEWELQIIGDGPLLEELQKFVINNGLQEKVHFLGFLENTAMRERMLRASIYAMTSISEGFGIVLVEAMDAGLPLVAYDVPVGPRAIIKNNENGYLIKDNDKKQFVKKIISLVEDNELRKQFGLKSKEEVQKYYLENVFKKWLTLIKDIENEK